MARKRQYTMRSRAATSASTRGRILAAATALFLETPYDLVSLEAVCRRAGVSLPTVLRYFLSKDALFVACGAGYQARESVARAVAPGDVGAAVRVLAERYEQMAPVWRRYLGLEDRFAAVAQVVGGARRGHLDWLSEVFAPFLPARRGARRTRRLAALFGATEIYVWWSWRTQLGLDAAAARRTMADLINSLVALWATEDAEDDR